MRSARRCTALTPVAAALLLLSLASLLLSSSSSSSCVSARSSLHGHRLSDSASAHLPPAPSGADLGSLVHVQVLHRHGDRAPVHVSPVDRPMWTERIGLRGGQLSRIGMAQLHALGKFMRQLYVHDLSFLPPTAGDAVTIRSTDVDRCLQSVHALLDELYPQSMIPVHTMPESQEKLLQPTDKCPSYLVSYRSILGELDGVLLRELTALPPPPGAGRDVTIPVGGSRAFNLLAYVAKATGWNERLLPSNLVTIATDNVVCLQSHGLPVPPLLLHSLPLLRNYTSQIYFHKFSPLHVRRAWDLDQGHPYTLADEATPPGQPADALDPRGTVGGLLVRHLAHHWQNKLAAQRELRTDAASLAGAVDPAVDAFVQKLDAAAAAAAAAAAGHTEAEEEAADNNPTPAAFFEMEMGTTISTRFRSQSNSESESNGHSVTRIHIGKEKEDVIESSETQHEGETETDSNAESEGGEGHASASEDAGEEEEYMGPFAPPPPGSAPSGPGSASLARRLRLRNKHHNSAAIARTASEKLMLYSAHDSTIIALMQSLGLITAPTSEYLLPPYAASVTFELRHKHTAAASSNNHDDAVTPDPMSGYYVNAYYGFPLPVEGGNPETPEGWSYHRHPIALRCPTEEGEEEHPGAQEAAPDEKGSRKDRPAWRARKRWQCPLAAFQRYALLSARSSLMEAAAAAGRPAPPPVSRHTANQVYAPDDGCCVRTGAFRALGCDATGSHAAARGGALLELESECVAFRARCPATACSDGYVLDPATFACVRVATGRSSKKNVDGDGHAVEGGGGGGGSGGGEGGPDGNWGVGPGRPRPDDLVIPIPSPVGVGMPVDPQHVAAADGIGAAGAGAGAGAAASHESNVEWLMLALGFVCMVGGFGGGVCYARMGGRGVGPFGGGKVARGSPVSYDYSVNGGMEEDRQSLLNGGAQGKRRSVSGAAGGPMLA